MEHVKKLLLLCKNKDLREIIYFCLEGWGYEVVLLEDEETVSGIKKKEPDLVIIDFPSSYKESLSLCEELKSDFVTKSIPLIVLIDRRQLRKPLLTLEHGIDDYLFKPPDPLDLRVRVEMALRRTQYSFYTNSLTKLPGGRIIQELVQSRLDKREKFSFAHIDIDNFKYFNDRYGYLKGDKVITQTAYILNQTVKNYGETGDFIGHIGGDDFVFISIPDKEKRICQEFIYQFDRLIPLHYSSTDRQNRFIKVEDRGGQVRKFPLMSVTVAVVNNRDRDFDSIIQINETLASLKSYLKKVSGSKFMVERRGIDRGLDGRIQKELFSRAHETIPSRNRILPLGQILIERNLITNDLLQEALNIHWRRGLPLGEVLKDQGLIKEEELQDILSWQKKV